MPIKDDELLAAVSGGVDSVTEAPATPVTPENTDADETGDEALGEGADGDSAGGAGAGGEPGDEPGDDADGPAGAGDGSEDPELGPDGKPVVKAGIEPELDPATGKPFTPEQVAAKAAEAEKAAFRKLQVEDPINAPIPKYLKQTTQERMTKLVGIAKDLTTKHNTVLSERNEIIGMITETGATAAQYTGALNYLRMVNSRDPEQIKAAIGVMQQELSALSRMAGVAVAGVDHLANHADLKAAVDAKQLTQALAEEIAAGREHRTLQTQQSRASQQTEQQAQAEHSAGVQALNAIGVKLKAADPNYAAKAQAVLAKIGDEMKTLPPSQWAQHFLVAYTTFQPPRAAVPPVRKVAAVPKNQPLRGNNPSGGVQSAPKSLEEAINFGIAAGTRR